MTAEQLSDILLNVDTEKLTEQTVDETIDDLIELQQQQMSDGVRADGEPIQWLKDSHYPYTLPYAKVKSRLGLQTSVVDLNLTGTFYRAEQIRVNAGNLEFDNSDPKSQYLEKNYGIQIQGLTDENTNIYREGTFGEKFRENFTEKTGLDFS